MASHYMCIMNYACYKDDLQDAKHMVTYIICFTFATRTPLSPSHLSPARPVAEAD